MFNGNSLSNYISLYFYNLSQIRFIKKSDLMTINNVRPILPSVAFIERDPIDHEYRGFE